MGFHSANFFFLEYLFQASIVLRFATQATNKKEKSPAFASPTQENKRTGEGSLWWIISLE